MADYYVVENSGKYSVEEFVISENATTKVSQDIAVSCVSAGQNATLELVDGAVITGTGQESSQVDVLMTSKNLTIKGNGKIVSNVPSTRKTSDVIRVGGGTLNIYDGITLEAGSGNEANYAIRVVKGTVNIYGGYFHTSNEGTCELIYLASGYASSYKCTLNISGGVFDCDGNASYMINCYDSYRSKCTVSITGGIFVGFNPADNIAEGEHTNFCADGYTTEETTYNGKKAWKVVAKPAE